MNVIVEWCTDGVPYNELGLPSLVKIPSHIAEDEISDYLSDKYGYLVESWYEWGCCH